AGVESDTPAIDEGRVGDRGDAGLIGNQISRQVSGARVTPVLEGFQGEPDGEGVKSSLAHGDPHCGETTMGWDNATPAGPRAVRIEGRNSKGRSGRRVAGPHGRS